MIEHCPVCAGVELVEVLDLGRLPTLPNARVDDPELARSVPVGDLQIVACEHCAHLFNRRFDEAAIGYDVRYDNSLHFSPTFVAHAAELVDRLRTTFDLDGSTIAEIGCGSADLLTMLCEASAARGFGFDPSVDPDRPALKRSPRVTLSATSYPLDGSLRPDLLLSQHVLEHLADPVAVLATTAATLAAGGNCYHEVPNGEQILRDTAIWDLIYEHVSYFTTVSLREALRRAGLCPTNVGTAFADQYLWVTARLSAVNGPVPDPVAVEEILGDARRFGERSRQALERAAEQLDDALRRGPVVLWGAGSKGISYLNLVDPHGMIAGVVDVNPRKVGTYVPGPGHRIGGPADVPGWAPATVLVANPVYIAEISRQVGELAPAAHTELLSTWSER